MPAPLDKTPASGPTSAPALDRAVVLYDGPCTLCNKSVQWLYRHDPHERLLFASLQGPWAQAHVPEALKTMDTVLFYDRGRWSAKSSALLFIAGKLPFPWRALQVFWLVPRFLRDFLYTRCAGRRYWIFGTGYCALVPPERLLDQPLEGSK